MFRKVLKFINNKKVLAQYIFRKKGNFDKIDKGGDLTKIAGETAGVETYHVKLLQVNKGKEARIMQLTAQIEALQMQIKALKKAKSKEARAARAELELVLKDLTQALRELRMNKKNGNFDKNDEGGDFKKTSKQPLDLQPYQLKEIEERKIKDASIFALTKQIEALQLTIKVLKRNNTDEATAARAELQIILEDLRTALRKLRTKTIIIKPK